MTLHRHQFLLAPVALLLAGCAAALPAPVSESPSVTPPTATATPSVDPGVMPTNRFGIDCAELVGADQLAAIFESPMPFKQSDEFWSVDIAALTHDRALACRWGEGPYVDDDVPSLSVFAAPYGSDRLLATVAGFAPPERAPATVEVAGIGDRAWVSCHGGDDGSGRFTASCAWTISMGDTWLVVQADSMSAEMVDLVKVSDYSYTAAVRSGTPITAVVASVAATVAGRTIEDGQAAATALPECASLAHWEGLSEKLGLPLTSVVPNPRHEVYSLAGRVVIEMNETSALNRGVRVCELTFGDSQDPTTVIVEVVPQGLWIAQSGFWRSSGEEYCYGFGYVCEVATTAGATAYYARASGSQYLGVAQAAVDALIVAN